LADLQTVDSRIGEEVIALLDNLASMNARNSKGGTSTGRTKEQIATMQQWLADITAIISN